MKDIELEAAREYAEQQTQRVQLHRRHLDLVSWQPRAEILCLVLARRHCQAAIASERPVSRAKVCSRESSAPDKIRNGSSAPCF